MDSPSRQLGHLDATTDRQVVYCHACEHEWYIDEGGSEECPQCDSDVIEIVDLQYDPRFSEEPPTPPLEPPGPLFRFRPQQIPDPDEADIEEYIGPDGMYHRRDTRQGNNQGHHNVGRDPVFERFISMVQNLVPTSEIYPEDEDSDYVPEQEEPPRGPPTIPTSASQSGFQRTTYTTRTFRGGTASFTIFTGASGPQQGHHQRPHATGPNISAPDDPFQTIFSGILRDLGPPGQRQEGTTGTTGTTGTPGTTGTSSAPQGLARGLQDILSLFNPANAVYGDAVYTQEALDRIVSNLMDANPQSNAAPPATDRGLAALERRDIDENLLRGESNTECTICQDEFNVGEKAAFLPCKHWFHDECVVPWLKSHNTCPICRAPIEEAGGARPHIPSNPQRASQSERPAPNNPWGTGQSAPWNSNAQPGRYSPGAGGWGSESTVPPVPPNRPGDPEQTTGITTGYAPRPPNQSQSRLNEALRNISSLQRERASTPDFNYDTSRLQRRSSHSPTSPRATAPGEYASRVRQRSPSESSRRAERERERDAQRQTGSGGGGAINWLRDRFGGASNRNARDER